MVHLMSKTHLQSLTVQYKARDISSPGSLIHTVICWKQYRFGSFFKLHGSLTVVIHHFIGIESHPKHSKDICQCVKIN